MSTFVKVATGIAILIGIYLFITNGDKTANIINILSSNAIKGIATLQGR